MSEKYKIKSFDDGKIILTPPPPPPGVFITTWYVYQGPFTFPISSLSEVVVEGTINWDDGSPDEEVTGPMPTHMYSKDGRVTITFTGTASVFSANGTDIHGDLLRSIVEWGSIGLTHFSVVFCNNIEHINPALPASLTSLSNAFYGISTFPDISKLEVGNVKNMSRIFMLSKFTQNISGWNVGSVTNMYSMFQDCPFNGDIYSWDVSSVEYMNSMFQDCLKFNQNIRDWDISSVQSMDSMFQDCPRFNKNISNWTVQLGVSYDNFDKNATIWVEQFKPVFVRNPSPPPSPPPPSP